MYHLENEACGIEYLADLMLSSTSLRASSAALPHSLSSAIFDHTSCPLGLLASFTIPRPCVGASGAELLVEGPSPMRGGRPLMTPVPCIACYSRAAYSSGWETCNIPATTSCSASTRHPELGQEFAWKLLWRAGLGPKHLQWHLASRQWDVGQIDRWVCRSLGCPCRCCHPLLFLVDWPEAVFW